MSNLDFSAKKNERKGKKLFFAQHDISSTALSIPALGTALRHKKELLDKKRHFFLLLAKIYCRCMEEELSPIIETYVLLISCCQQSLLALGKSHIESERQYIDIENF